MQVYQVQPKSVPSPGAWLWTKVDSKLLHVMALQPLQMTWVKNDRLRLHPVRSEQGDDTLGASRLFLAPWGCCK
jgi:hypothetical protein